MTRPIGSAAVSARKGRCAFRADRDATGTSARHTRRGRETFRVTIRAISTIAVLASGPFVRLLVGQRRLRRQPAVTVRGVATAVLLGAHPWLDAHKTSTVRTCLGTRCADLRYHRLQLVRFPPAQAPNNVRLFPVEVRFRTAGTVEIVRTIHFNAHPTTRVGPCRHPVVFTDIVLIDARGRVHVEYSPGNCTAPQ